MNAGFLGKWGHTVEQEIAVIRALSLKRLWRDGMCKVIWRDWMEIELWKIFKLCKGCVLLLLNVSETDLILNAFSEILCDTIFSDP